MSFDEPNFSWQNEGCEDSRIAGHSYLAELGTLAGVMTPAQDSTCVACLPGLAIDMEQPSAGNSIDQPGVQSSDQPVVENGALVRRLGSASWRTREASHAELQDRGLCALPDLLNALDSNDLEMRRRAGQLIDNLGSSALPYLLSASRGDDARVRGLANGVLRQFSTEELLSHVYDHPEDGKNVLRNRPSIRNEMEGLLNEGERPQTPQGFRAAIAAAELLGAHVQRFHLSAEYGASRLRDGDAAGGLRAVDAALSLLEQRREGLTVLHGFDLRQQLTDALGSEGGQALPASVRRQIEQRITRAEQLAERLRFY